jgi:nucleoside-diphosphate-sugar epimerase
VVEVADARRLRALLADRESVYLTIAPRTPGEDYREVYLASARRLLAAARGTAVRRIIYTSSTRVYGQDDGSWVDERSPTEPKDEKGRILLEAERTLLSASPETDSHRTEEWSVTAPAAGPGAALTLEPGQTVHVTVVRMSGIYGPGRMLDDRVHAAAGTERRGGAAFVNLIHRDDIVTALTALLTNPYHGVLNLSNDQPEQRQNLYDRIIAQGGLPPIRWVTGDQSAGRAKRIRNTLIKRTLGLTLQHPGY